MNEEEEEKKEEKKKEKETLNLHTTCTPIHTIETDSILTKIK